MGKKSTLFFIFILVLFLIYQAAQYGLSLQEVANRKQVVKRHQVKTKKKVVPQKKKDPLNDRLILKKIKTKKVKRDGERGLKVVFTCQLNFKDKKPKWLKDEFIFRLLMRSNSQNVFKSSSSQYGFKERDGALQLSSGFSPESIGKKEFQGEIFVPYSLINIAAGKQEMVIWLDVVGEGMNTNSVAYLGSDTVQFDQPKQFKMRFNMQKLLLKRQYLDRFNARGKERLPDIYWTLSGAGFGLYKSEIKEDALVGVTDSIDFELSDGDRLKLSIYDYDHVLRSQDIFSMEIPYTEKGYKYRKRNGAFKELLYEVKILKN